MNTNLDMLNKKLNELMELVPQWKQCFDTTPDIDLLFTVDYAGMLMVNGIVLCPLSVVMVESITYDIYGFSIPTYMGEIYSIGIDWAYDAAAPSISIITKTSTLYYSEI